jgi:voltage-dependent calcium channel L type alpha-1D
MAFYDYADTHDKSLRNKIIENSGYIFSIIFCIEAIIKVIAMGFVTHKNSYLRDGWN